MSNPTAMRILIVDDDAIMRMLLKNILQQEPDLQLAEAENGLIAWNRFHQDRLPDLCLLDIMMPEMDGMELLQKMRAEDRLKRIPVILCTAVRDRQAIVQAAAMQVAYYLVKPFSPPRVLAEVRKVREYLDHAGPISDAAAVRERLGLDAQEFVERLQALANLIDKGLPNLRIALTKSDRQAFAWCLEAMQKTGQELGTDTIVDVILHLAEGIKSPDLSPLNQELDGLHAECRRLKQYIAKLSEQMAPATDE